MMRVRLPRAMPERRFPPPWTVEETDACFIEKPPRFGASNGPHGVPGCRNRLIERRLNAVRECSAPQSRDVPLRIADYCLAAMLVLGMLGAAAAENQVQGALQGQNNGQPVHIEAMPGNPGQGQDSDVLRQRQGGPGRHDDEMPNPCRVLRAGRRCGRYQGRRRPHIQPRAKPPPACRKEEASAGPKRAAT